jgi:hypothetical protein
VSVTRRRLVAMELVRPTARSMRWGPLLGAGAAAAVITFLLTRAPECAGDVFPCIDLDERIQFLRMAMVLVAIGAGFALDDPSRETTAHVPASLLLRRFVRVVMLTPALAVLWMLLLGVALRTGGGDGFPFRAVTLELAALVVAALAVSAAAERFVPEGLGGVAAGPTLLALVGAAFALPQRFRLFFSGPTDPGWDGSHERWLIASAIAALGLVHYSRDPGRTHLVRRRERPSEANASGSEEPRVAVRVDGSVRP